MSESIERLREACLLCSTHKIREALDGAPDAPATLRDVGIDMIITNGRADLLTDAERAAAIERRKSWLEPYWQDHVTGHEIAWLDQVRQELVQLGAYPMKSAAKAGRIGLSTEEQGK
jgi:hypothetical protein